MIQPELPTLSAMITQYRGGKMKDEIWGDWGSVFVYRPPAFLLAFLLARLGVTPNMVTVAGLLLLPAMLVVSFFARPDPGLVVVCLLAALFCILDCVDGEIARLRLMSSPLGRFIDLAADLVYRVVAYASLGHIADLLSPPPPALQDHGISWLAVMLLTAWLALFVRLCRVSADDGTAAAGPGRDVGKSRDIGSVVFAVFSGLDTLLPFVALMFWSLGALDYLVLWLLAYTAMDIAYALPAILARLARTA